MSDSTTLKRCTQCGESFPATTDHFYLDRSCKAGLTPQCRACRKATWAKNAAEQNEKRRIKDAPNQATIYAQRQDREAPRRDEVKERKRQYKKGRQEVVNEQARLSYAENPEAFKKRSAKWVAANPDKVTARTRRYRAENPEKIRQWGRANVQKRNTIKAGLPNTFTEKDWLQCLDHFNGRCAACGNPPDLFNVLERDHWIPLTSKDCPGTIPTNMIPLCNSCNSGKRNRNAEQWAVEKFGNRKGKNIAKEVKAYFDSLA